MIIDVSCDPYLEIETSHPTTIDHPVYTVDGVIHYAVDNTPAMYPYTTSKIFSRNFLKYADALASGATLRISAARLTLKTERSKPEIPPLP